MKMLKATGEGVLIVKIQRSFFSSTGQVLIYNKDRTIEYQQAMTPEFATLFGQDEYKVFHKAELDQKTGLLHIGELADWQDW